MPAVSIIVPIYNVEKYLPKCIESILKTAWQKVSYEIIVVNDESPDGSLAIAEGYAEKHLQIRVITQPNKGLGGARNTGLRSSKGEYVFFLDSDDYLISDQMPELVTKAQRLKVDILEFSALTVREDYSVIQHIFPVENLSPVSGTDYYGNYPPSNSVCNKLYRRQFLKEQSIVFMENVYVEDAPFNVEAYLKAKTAASFPLIPVAYLQNTTSITRQKRTGAQMDKFITDSIKVTSKMKSFLSDDLPTPAQDALKKKLAIFVSGTLLMILKSQKPYKSKLVDLENLKSLRLYPMKYSSGIRIRDIFLTFVNYPGIFLIANKLFSLKHKL